MIDSEFFAATRCALSCAIIVVPFRLWTLAATISSGAPINQSFLVYPWPAQLFVIIAHLWLAISALWITKHLGAALGLALVSCLVSAALQWYSSPSSSPWVLWTSITIVEGATLYHATRARVIIDRAISEHG